MSNEKKYWFRYFGIISALAGCIYLFAQATQSVSDNSQKIEKNTEAILELSKSKVDKEMWEFFIKEYRINEERKQNQLDRIEQELKR